MLDLAQLKALSSALAKLRNAVRNSSSNIRWRTPRGTTSKPKPKPKMPRQTLDGGKQRNPTNTDRAFAAPLEKGQEVFFRKGQSDRIQNKVAMVIGGCEGVGLTCVHELLRNDVKGVMIADRRDDGLKCVKEFAKEFGTKKVAFIRIDNSPEVLRHAFASTVHHFRGLDIVVTSLKFQEEKGWTAQIDENVKGVVMNTLFAMEFMGRHCGGRGGTVVNIAECFDEHCGSCPLFHGVQEFLVGFDRSLASDNYPNSDVKVLTICQATLESVGVDLATVISKGRNGCVWTP